MAKNLTIAEQLAADELAGQQPAGAPKGISEEAIAEKTQAGLTRDQAIAVITAQAAEDAPKKSTKS